MKRNNWLIVGGLVLCASVFAIFSGKGVDKQEVNAITVERTGRVANMAKPVVVNETINSTGKEVSSQLELRNALNDSSLSSIIINNDNGEEFNIPSGDYSKVSLVVNAPNSDITNQGLFKDITINAIASDTWIEKVNGNILILNAAAGHIVVPNDVEVTEIRIVNKTVDSQFVLDIAGEVSKITIDSTSDVKLNVSGKVGDIEINERASLAIEGTSRDSINITISEEADGTMITSGVELNVESASDADIVLKKGAEGSKVAILDETKVVEVTNNTTEKVIVKTVDDNNVVEIDPKRNGIINAQGQVVGTTTGEVTGVDGITPPATPVVPVTPSEPSSGQSGSESGSSNDSGSGSGDNPGSGEAQSSGNITRIITRFETIPSICAGTVGETLLPVGSINFPSYVVGVAVNGERISFPIISWENTDNYSTASMAGNYSFTGILGEPVGNIKYSISYNIAPVCRVYVKAISSLEFANEFSHGIDVQVYENAAGNIEYYVLTNNTDKCLGYLSIKKEYFDANGYLIQGVSDSKGVYRTVQIGETNIIAFYKSQEPVHSARKVTITASGDYVHPEDVRNGIDVTCTKGNNCYNVHVKNNSNRVIRDVTLDFLFLDANGKAITTTSRTVSDVYAPGYESDFTIEYPYDGQGGRIEPTSYIMYKRGAYTTNETPITTPAGNDENNNSDAWVGPWTYQGVTFNAAQVAHFHEVWDYTGDAKEMAMHHSASELLTLCKNDGIPGDNYPDGESGGNEDGSNSWTGPWTYQGVTFNAAQVAHFHALWDYTGDALEMATHHSAAELLTVCRIDGIPGDNYPEGESGGNGENNNSDAWVGPWTYQGVTFSVAQVAHFHALWDYTGDAQEMATRHSAEELLTVCRIDGIQ